MQLTLMSINVGEDIGVEIHPNIDQFLRIEQGQGLVQMGYQHDNLNMQAGVTDGDAIFVPAGDMAQSNKHRQHTVKTILNICSA